MESRIFFGVLAILALVIAGCQSQASPTGNAVDNADAPVKEIVMKSYANIIDGKYYPAFDPKDIVVNKGDKVRLKITVTKGIHDFNIDEFNVHAETPLDQEIVVEFIADKAGKFEYYCNKPGHRAAGHWGTITVLE